MKRAPLRPVVTERFEHADHVRERVEIQTEPGVTMPLYVLIPKTARPPYAPVLALHGHQSRGKSSVVGDVSDPRVAASIREFNYDYGLRMVREGLMVFAPDARGFGERLEAAMPANAIGGSCEFIQKWALPLGQTLAGMWAWDNHRLLDYIQTREECRKEKAGCAGLSGGGMQTLYAAALDRRISCAVISGYLVGFKAALLEPDTLACADNVVPGLSAYMDMGDIAAMIAPRPLLIETGRQDPINGTGGVQNAISQVEVTRSAYRLLGSEDRLAHDLFEGGHRWHGLRAIPWLKKWLTS
jgi:dienelactone hydrolase